jgi:copper chaperone CopZ
MKKILLFNLVLFLGISALSAQQKKPITVKISTPAVQCEECKVRVENYLKYEEGVTKVVADFRKKQTTITYLADRTNIENIKTAIANAGFDADDVKAEDGAYKKLPPCCKRPEDGGGPPKH